MMIDEMRSPRRRDVLRLAAVHAVGVGGSAPAFGSARAYGLPPNSSVIAVDLTKIIPGSGIRVIWRRKPVFVRLLTAQEIEAAEAVPLTTLRDPETLAERTRRGHKNWLVTYGLCTHLGCALLGITPQEQRGAFGGYACPCHGSLYDTAGRIRSGPAPRNLEIPEYRFRSPGVLEIGAPGAARPSG